MSIQGNGRGGDTQRELGDHTVGGVGGIRGDQGHLLPVLTDGAEWLPHPPEQAPDFPGRPQLLVG